MRTPKQLGQFGEEIAEKELKKKGYKILAKNFRNKWGELDLVVKKKRKIIFVEVKTIQKREGFLPEDEIDRKKKKQLIKMSQIYLSENKIPFEGPWQIDIIAIEVSPGFEKAKIRHYQNAIEDSY